MSNAFFKTPLAINEPVKLYAKGSEDRTGLLSCYNTMYSQQPIDVPMYIGAKEIRTSNKKPLILGEIFTKPGRCYADIKC